MLLLLNITFHYCKFELSIEKYVSFIRKKISPLPDWGVNLCEVAFPLENEIFLMRTFFHTIPIYWDISMSQDIKNSAYIPE